MRDRKMFRCNSGSCAQPRRFFFPAARHNHKRRTAIAILCRPIVPGRAIVVDQINASKFSDLEIACASRRTILRPPGIQARRHAPNGQRRPVRHAGSRERSSHSIPARENALIHGEHEGKRGGAAPRQLSGRGSPIGPTEKKNGFLRHAGTG